MIIPEKPIIFHILFAISLLASSCEHHCPLPQEKIERTIEIRQDLNSKGDGDAYLNSHITLETTNGRGDLHNIVANWTRFGDPVRYRSYLNINLSEIKSSEEVISAALILYPKPTGSDGTVPDIVNQTFNQNNVQVCLVKDSWDMTTLSWINQPRYSELPEDYIVFTVPENLPSVIELDVTNLLKSIAGKTKKLNNNGFLFKMAPEANAPPYRSFVFYSMNADTSKQPYFRIHLKSDI